MNARLERAENILRTLERGEADAVLSSDGPRLVHSVDAIERERQIKLALEELVNTRALELVAARESRDVAEASTRAKSDFLSRMSHELRTPLNAILGFAQLLDSGPTPLTPSQKRNIDQVLSAGWHLLGLVNEILDLAQIEAGKVVLSWESLSLADVMLDCRSMLEPLAQRRGIAMRLPQFDIPYFVIGDRIRVKQILINLIYNAVKYNKPEGLVSVECALVPPNSIRIGVRDTGAGLTPEQLAQLFQPFSRLGGKTGTDEGTGIGLVVAKQLVELMGGSIGADSVIGVGSVFWTELPLTAAPPSAVSEAEQAVPVQPPILDGSPRNTVLYVEDNAANLNLVDELIKRRPDLRLLTATDGNLGIELARTCAPDVILMDINLPGMNGLQAMRILRADPSTKHIPVIAVSAFAMPVEIERALEAGFFSYLTKPINLNEFMVALNVAIKFSRAKAASAATRP